MTFAARLLEAFDGASMAEIARRLELPHSTIRNYVQHGRLPSAEVLIEIATRTNISLNWLLTGNGTKQIQKPDRLATSLTPPVPSIIDMDNLVALITKVARREIAMASQDFVEMRPAEMILAPIIAHVGDEAPEEEVRKAK